MGRLGARQPGPDERAGPAREEDALRGAGGRASQGARSPPSSGRKTGRRSVPSGGGGRLRLPPLTGPRSGEALPSVRLVMEDANGALAPGKHGKAATSASGPGEAAGGRTGRNSRGRAAGRHASPRPSFAGWTAAPGCSLPPTLSRAGRARASPRSGGPGLGGGRLTGPFLARSKHFADTARPRPHVTAARRSGAALSGGWPSGEHGAGAPGASRALLFKNFPKMTHLAGNRPPGPPGRLGQGPRAGGGESWPRQGRPAPAEPRSGGSRPAGDGRTRGAAPCVRVSRLPGPRRGLPACPRATRARADPAQPAGARAPSRSELGRRAKVDKAEASLGGGRSPGGVRPRGRRAPRLRGRPDLRAQDEAQDEGARRSPRPGRGSAGNPGLAATRGLVCSPTSPTERAA